MPCSAATRCPTCQLMWLHPGCGRSMKSWSVRSARYPIATKSAVSRVDLVIDEPFADRKAAWPITTGVPFPRGKLTSAEHCRLIDDRGVARPLQARVAATWDAERKSVRWLTIDFVAEPGRKYALEFGDDVVQPQFAAKLVDARDDVVTVSTGALRAEFSAAGAAALRMISADLN